MNRVVLDSGSSELSDSDISCDFAVAVGEHREHEEVEPVVDRLVERFENARLVAVAALPLEQFLRLVAAVAAEVGMQQVDHRPQCRPFLDVHLKQIPQVVQARTAMAEHPLLLDAGRLGIALRDDQPPQLVAELARHFLPHRLAEEIAEADPAIRRRLGEEDAPAIFRQLDVLEMRPPFRIHADRRAHVDLVVILKALRPHVAHHWMYLGCQCSSARCRRLLPERLTLLGIFSAEIMCASNQIRVVPARRTI
jgi:hypothetical protein